MITLVHLNKSVKNSRENVNGASASLSLSIYIYVKLIICKVNLHTNYLLAPIFNFLQKKINCKVLKNLPLNLT